nr:hypothetical protein [Pedobacter panaciterrae]
MENQMIFVRIATIADIKHVDEIVKETESSAIARGSGIAKRSPESIVQKIKEGKGVIAVTGGGEWVGFSYFEVWESNSFVSNSGLIVAPKFRNAGVAKAIKDRIFKISRRIYPEAKIFSITSGAAIMKMNSQLGFEPVTFDQITHDEHFWEGCKSCVNYNILEGKKRCNCLCTAMLFDPQKENFSSYALTQAIEKCEITLDCIACPKLSLAVGAEGTNLICSALTDILWFSEYTFPIESNLPDPVKMTVTNVNMDGGQNCSSKECRFTVSIVYDHNYTEKEILNTIRNHTRCKFTVRQDVLNVSIIDDSVYEQKLVLNNC